MDLESGYRFLDGLFNGLGLFLLIAIIWLLLPIIGLAFIYALPVLFVVYLVLKIFRKRDEVS